jgi:hypothetical protein
VRSGRRRTIAEAVLGVAAAYVPLETGFVASALSNDTRPNDYFKCEQNSEIALLCILLLIK